MEREDNGEEIRATGSKKKHYWLAVIDILMFAVLFYVFFMLFSMPLTLVYDGFDTSQISEDIQLLLLSETIMLISAFLAAWVVLGVQGLPLAGLGLSLKGRWRDWGHGIAFAIILYAVGFGLSLAFGAVEIVGVVFQPSSLLLTLLFYLLVAVAEELMARGFILGRLIDGGVNKYLALFISSVIFSLMHIYNPNFALVPFLNIVLAGIFLGASYIYTRNLCFPIALHWFWNWLQGPILGYEVSGNKYGDSLLQLRLPEANLLNGGTFGFEGSILCSVLLVVGTVIILRNSYKL